jgi:hypothetical protein
MVSAWPCLRVWKPIELTEVEVASEYDLKCFNISHIFNGFRGYH